MDTVELLSGGIGLFLMLFLVVLAVLWFLLPFAIFGTKNRLSTLIAETQRTNDELARISRELAAVRAERAGAASPEVRATETA